MSVSGLGMCDTFQRSTTLSASSIEVVFELNGEA